MSVDTVVEIISKGGLIPVLLIILWSGVKRYWVFGWQYKEAIADRDEWKAAALTGTLVAARAVELASEKSGENG